MTTTRTSEAELSMSAAWEAEAQAWIRWARTPGHDSYWRFHRDAFFSLLPAPPHKTLDAGCGEGRVARDLQARGYEVTGLDSSATLLAAARELDPKGTYVEASMSAMPFPDASFSLVFAFMSLQDVDELDRAVAECARVLRPDGTFACAVVHPINSAGGFEGEATPQPFVLRRNYFETFRYVDRIERAGHSMTFHSEHHSLERYVRAFEAAGLLLEALREPIASGPEPHSESTLRWQRVPLFLHLRARRK